MGIIPVLIRKVENTWFKYFARDFVVPLWSDQLRPGQLYPPMIAVLRNPQRGESGWDILRKSEYFRRFEIAANWLKPTQGGGSIGDIILKGVLALEFVFAGPKSFSLACLCPHINHELIAIHERAVDTCLRLLSQVLFTRSGGERLPVDVEAMRFRHPLSKAKEPHLHDHVLIPTYPLNSKTKLHYILITYYAEFLRQIYDYELIRGLQELGIAIEFQHPRHPQKWELAGFDRKVIESYSSRSMALKSTKRGTDCFDETAGKRAKGVLESERVKWVDKPRIPEVIYTTKVDHLEPEIPPWAELFGNWEKRTELQLLGSVAGHNLGCGMEVDDLLGLLQERTETSILSGTISRESAPSDDATSGVSVIGWEEFSPKESTRTKSSGRRKPMIPLIWKCRDRDMEIVVAHGSFTSRSCGFQKALKRMDPMVSCVIAPPGMGRMDFERLGVVIEKYLLFPKHKITIHRERLVPLPFPGEREQVTGTFLLPVKKCLGFKSEKTWQVIAANEEKITISRPGRKRTLDWLDVEKQGDKLILLHGWPLQIPSTWPCIAQVSRRKGGLLINKGDIVEPVEMQGSDLLLADGRALPSGCRIIEPAYWTRVLPLQAIAETIITLAPPKDVNLTDWLAVHRCARLVVLTPRPDSLRTRIRGFLLEQQEKMAKARSRRSSSSSGRSMELDAPVSNSTGQVIPLEPTNAGGAPEVLVEIPYPSLTSVTSPTRSPEAENNQKKEEEAVRAESPAPHPQTPSPEVKKQAGKKKKKAKTKDLDDLEMG